MKWKHDHVEIKLTRRENAGYSLNEIDRDFFLLIYRK